MRSHQTECVTLTASAPDFVDITEDVAGALARSGISDGRVTVFAPDDACSLLVQERESGLLVDIEHALHRLRVSEPLDRRSLVGSPSIVLPAIGGRLRLGAWQRVLLVELAEPRARTVVVHIVGE